MNNTPRNTLYFARQHKNLLALLTDLRALDGGSALLWLSMDNRTINDDVAPLMKQLVSTTRALTVGANAGYFVEQMSPCSLAAVLEVSDESANFGQLVEQLHSKIRQTLGATIADSIKIDLLLNHGSTGTVGEMVATMATSRCAERGGDCPFPMKSAA